MKTPQQQRRPPATPDPNEARRRAFSPFLTFEEFRPLSATVRVDVGVRSHAGAVRSDNDDHYLILRMARQQETLATSLPTAEEPQRFEEQGYAMLVADGLGRAGSLAGRIAIGTIAHLSLHYGRWHLRIDPRTAEEVRARLEWYYRAASEAVVARSAESPELTGMATALTAAISAGDDLFIAHTGHTRGYLYRDGALVRMTRDHTIEHQQNEVRRPVAVEGQGRDLRHILTDAIGASTRPGVDVEHFKLENGDSLLLCTNGLTDLIGDEHIADVLAERRRSDEQCELLVDSALRAGGTDNVTVLVAQYRVPIALE